MKRFLNPLIMGFIFMILIQSCGIGKCSYCGGDKQSGSQWVIDSNHGAVSKKSGKFCSRHCAKKSHAVDCDYCRY